MRMMRRIVPIILTTLLLAAPSVQALDFGVDDDKGQSVVKVVSNNPLMTMEHWTSSIEGIVSFDPADVNNEPKINLTVTVADLSSHSTLWASRDKLMHSQYLETALFEEATFELTEITSASADELKDFTPVEITANGNFTLHGVTKPITVTATVIFMKESLATQARGAGDLLSIKAEWTFNLSDYEIKIPKKGPIAFEDEQRMTMEFVASTAK